MSNPRVTARASRSAAPFPTPVRLTRPGTHEALDRVPLPGLELVDAQFSDVDGDGDQDALVLLDVAADPRAREDRRNASALGRGIAVIYRERHGWRGQTLASLPLESLHAGYNWGPIEALQEGTPPLLHVWYSSAGPEGTVQRATVLHYHRGRFEAVYTGAVASSGSSGPAAVARTIAVQSADVDGDGTHELLEQVAERVGCPTTGCFTPDGLRATSVTRRVLRWDPTQATFLDAPDLRARLSEASRALAASRTRWIEGDFTGRDAELTRAYRIDPLDPAVRMAFARMQVRQHEYQSALAVLEFPWTQGFGRAALALQVEAAARTEDPACGRYLAALRAADPERAEQLLVALGDSATRCTTLHK